MRVRLLGSLLGAALLLAVSGCQAGDSDAGERQPSPSPTVSSPAPTPGGDLPAAATPPAHPMDDLEQAVAARLDRQVAREGLHLQYVACPAWHGKAPQRLTCQGYLDGVITTIHLRLSRLVGGAISFRARMARGLVSTAMLEAQLRKDGFAQVNCGDAPAYPSVVGSRVVCAVTKQGRKQFVVAQVTSPSGSVMIRGY